MSETESAKKLPAAGKKIESGSLSLQLQIDPVIARADAMVEQIRRELPEHPGIERVARSVAHVARNARDVSRKLKHPIGLHRLPALFLTFSLFLLGLWIYWQFFYSATLRIAVPEKDAIQLKESVGQNRLLPRVTVGSKECIDLLERREVDAAFIQGGIDIPPGLIRAELDQSEILLLFLKEGISDPRHLRKVLTSAKDQGSHSLARKFMVTWGISDRVEYLHDWRTFASEKNYVIPADVDGVFAVKDPMSLELDGTMARLRDAGFRPASPNIGAQALRMEYLKPFTLIPGYLDPIANVPSEAVPTYSVTTYLAAQPDLTAQKYAILEQLQEHGGSFPAALKPTLTTASEMAQGLEAVLGILVYIGVAFLALLGLDALTYRRCFHELNTLVSLISMHQSSKDVISGSRELRAHHVAYLAVCSDLLGLIAVITGYYTQENSSLMYNRLAEIIHERCNGLKINIQLKILHATIDLPESNAAQRIAQAESNRSPS
ncbi:MAG: hypothetical protein U0892_10220 [Pirellulales bacterium]